MTSAGTRPGFVSTATATAGSNWMLVSSRIGARERAENAPTPPVAARVCAGQTSRPGPGWRSEDVHQNPPQNCLVDVGGLCFTLNNEHYQNWAANGGTHLSEGETAAFVAPPGTVMIVWPTPNVAPRLAPQAHLDRGDTLLRAPSEAAGP